MLYVGVFRPLPASHFDFNQKISIEMSKYWIALVLLSMIIVNALAEEKLQIGIKKKVEDCERKSKKGDRLHMHYTVICLSSL